MDKDGNLRLLDRVAHSRVFETPITTVENAEARVTLVVRRLGRKQ